jgi:hypothetical protein
MIIIEPEGELIMTTKDINMNDNQAVSSTDEWWDEKYATELKELKTEIITPTRHDDRNDSRNRIAGLKHLVGHDIPDNFDPHEISWVLPNLGVTGKEGADEAIKQGHFVINVANELSTNATVKMPIEPSNEVWGFHGENTVLPTLEKIVNTMTMAMDTGQKVVVNCSMGMERSVLATVWYLVRNKGMNLDNAYGFVRSVRPIATDRREWIIS